MSDETYSDDEVHEILARAVGDRGGVGGLSHQELMEIADDVGISVEALERAAVEVRQERGSKSLQAEAEEALAIRNRARRANFWSHFVTWAVISLGLVGIDVLAGDGVGWAQWPIMIWGMLVLLQAARMVVRDREADLDRETQIVRVRREREAARAAKEAAKQEWIRKGGAPGAFTRGIALALNRAADQIDSALNTGPVTYGRPSRKGRPSRPKSAVRRGAHTRPPQVRVEPSVEEEYVVEGSLQEHIKRQNER